MIYSLGLQATYTHSEVGIFQDGKLILSAEKDKALASRELIPLCSALLMEVEKSLDDITYIAINQGPAPFTTLRTVITTANGLAYATKIPLIGIDGLSLLLAESLQRYTGTSQAPVVVLHAFGNDVYCGYKQQGGSSYFGCLSLPECIEQLSKQTLHPYVLVGNGALMHRKIFKDSLGDHIIIPEITQPYASLTALGEHAWQEWQAKKIQSQVQPLYLKKTL